MLDRVPLLDGGAELDPDRVAVRVAQMGELLAELAGILTPEAKLGREDVVLVDRPGRGYGDDYSPWFTAGPVGEFVRVRGGAVTEEGIVAA